MRQIVYLSKTSADFSEAGLRNVLDISRLNNRQVYVTGLLLFDGRQFLQALEGESLNVAETFKKISLDSRHRDLSIISDREVERREFGNWAMAANDDGEESFSGRVSAFIGGVSSSRVRTKFENFADYV